LDSNSNRIKYRKIFLGGAGTQTAALAFGGFIPPPTAATELWNGTSWTTSPATINTARNNLTELEFKLQL
jgi:hypothetical protein